MAQDGILKPLLEADLPSTVADRRYNKEILWTARRASLPDGIGAATAGVVRYSILRRQPVILSTNDEEGEKMILNFHRDLLDHSNRTAVMAMRPPKQMSTSAPGVRCRSW
jgi:hypothetical protein